MKTLEALYQEVLASDEKKKELAQAAQDEKNLENWIRAQGCDATGDQVQAFLKEKQAKAGELSDDELASAAGGCNDGEAISSALTFGVECAIRFAESRESGNYGSGGPDGKLLCHD